MPKRARPKASDTLPRQWTLYRLLQQAPAPGATTRALGEQLHTSKANVERDLQVLAAAGFPVVSTPDPEHHQRLLWRVSESTAAPAPGFGPADLLSLYAASSVLQFMANTPVHMDLQNVLSKVRASLAANHNKAVARMANVFTSHLRDYVAYDGEDRRAILDDLMDAVARTRKCRVEYQGADARRPKPYTLLPLRIFAHHSGLYVLAQVEHRTGVQTFAVHRLQQLEVLPDTFEPPHLDLDAFASQAFGVFIEPPQDVEVLFEAEVARYVQERTFHPSEHKEPRPDGRLTYRVRAGGKNEVVAWVLSFGGAASLVAPAAWRQELHARAQRALDAHR